MKLGMLTFVTLLLVASSTGYCACNIVNGRASGDCADVQLNNRAKGRLTVRSYISEGGIIDGATVLKGGDLELSGISNGNISVHQGARFRLTGIVNGTVNNFGGDVEIEGTLNHIHSVGGKVVIGGIVGGVSGKGPVSYRNGAVVGGVPVKARQ